MFVHENQEQRSVFYFGFSLCFHWLSIFITLRRAVAAFFPFLSYLQSLFPFSSSSIFFLSYLFWAPAFDFFIWCKIMYSWRLRCHLGWWQVVQPLLLEKVTQSLYIVVYLAFHSHVSAVFRLKGLKIALFICSNFNRIAYFIACLCGTKFEGQGLCIRVYRDFFTFYYSLYLWDSDFIWCLFVHSGFWGDCFVFP